MPHLLSFSPHLSCPPSSLFPSPPSLPPSLAGMNFGAPFSLLQNGQPVARVEKAVFSLTDKYTLHLVPGVDSLLYVCIISCIERIHHEIEEKHRRQAAASHHHHHHHHSSHHH